MILRDGLDGAEAAPLLRSAFRAPARQGGPCLATLATPSLRGRNSPWRTSR
jgi:hypothetical protein